MSEKSALWHILQLRIQWLDSLDYKTKTASVLVKHIGVPKFESKSDAKGIICMQGKEENKKQLEMAFHVVLQKYFA